MDLGLKNKTALVLGAGGGLGGAIARSLAAEGANVAIADVAKDSLSATAKSITDLGVEPSSCPGTWRISLSWRKESARLKNASSASISS